MTMVQNGKSAIQKRARPQLSCNFCRSGKLKCDRKDPCDQCVKRSKESTCQYMAAPPKKTKEAKSAKDRISHLEDLVIKLIHQNQTENGHKASEQEESAASTISGTTVTTHYAAKSGNGSPDPATAFGRMEISQDGNTNYVGAGHWSAILNGIEELKAAMKDEDEPTTDTASPADVMDEQQSDSAQLLMNYSGGAITREQLIQAIPSKEFSENMLWHWFNSSNPSLSAIHKPTFQKEYAQLREDSSKVPTMWLAVFFSMLATGCQFAALDRHEQSPQAQANTKHYQSLCVKALILADYTVPKKFTAEGILLLLTSMHLDKSVSPVMMWLTVSTLLRLLMRMGYHREPSLSPIFTVFEAEMRRRVWNIVYIFDVLSSFGMGLPDLISQLQADVNPPSNLLDTDFGPESKILPPARPDSELSTVTYIIAKLHIARSFAKIADVSNRVTSATLSEIAALDREIESGHDNIPLPMKFVALDSSIADPPAVIFNRYKLELMYLKAKISLYRRFVGGSPEDELEQGFQVKCVEAAMQTLGHLETIFLSSRDGGQLNKIPYFLSTLGSQDFFLAATILCAVLNRFNKNPIRGYDTPEKALKIRTLLEAAYQTYKTPTPFFEPPAALTKALKTMLGKVSDKKQDHEDPVQQGGVFGTSGMTPVFIPAPMEGINYTQPGDLSQDYLYPSAATSFDFSQNLDWNSLDRFLFETNLPTTDHSFPISSGDMNDFQGQMMLDPSLPSSFLF